MRQPNDIASDRQGDQEEWRALINRLSHGEEPPPRLDDATSFDDPMVRKRVGVVITRAVLGDPLYQLYQLYCGDPWPL
jgi:hypothetical protein